MFVINLILTENTDEKTAAEHLAAHRAWFSSHVEKGDFVLVGPRRDRERAGIIISRVTSREALDEILSEDVYFPSGAAYERCRPSPPSRAFSSGEADPGPIRFAAIRDNRPPTGT